MRCFDFCFTLVNVNTTYSFVDYCASKSGFCFKTKLFFIKVFSKILLMFGFINSSQHSKFRVSVLKGTKLVDLRCFSKGFALILNEHINEDVFCKLTAESFNDAIIVSNSLEFVIKDFLELKSLEYPVIGSSLVDDGLKLLGEYDLYVPSKGKVNVLLERYPSVVIDEFYTDDFEADCDLVDFSTVSRFVSKGKIAL